MCNSRKMPKKEEFFFWLSFGWKSAEKSLTNRLIVNIFTFLKNEECFFLPKKSITIEDHKEIEQQLNGKTMICVWEKFEGWPDDVKISHKEFEAFVSLPGQSQQEKRREKSLWHE